jgi:pyruvate/2-oxoacid:ferredoxin oxidoreductase beta subunit
VRRLRARFDFGRDHPGLLRAVHRPHRVAKLSGIGCSSKTPTYFLGASHGFNSVHGRMPSVLTGAALANRDLIYLGVSGDGDSASIGLGSSRTRCGAGST